jgi:putative addiction module component (TIGR02574 family)
MPINAVDLHKQAMQLPVHERAELVNGLRTSLLAHEHEVESAWQAVASERLQQYNRGEIKAQPIEKLLTKLKAVQ